MACAKRLPRWLLPLPRWLPPLVLVLIILGEGALSVAQDWRNYSLPAPTHHHQFLMVKRLAREIEGWTPVDPKCAPWNCNAGFDAPPELAPPRTLANATRWFWDQGTHYTNRSPLHGLPTALLTLAFPGKVGVAIFGLRIWFAILLVGVYRLGSMARGPGTGLLAAVITAGTPGLFATSLVHADTTALAAITTWLVVAILSTDGLLKFWWAVAVGLLAIVAYRCAENASNVMGVGIIVAVPAVVTVVQAAAGFYRDRNMRRIRGLVLTGLPPVAMALRYWRNESTMSYMTLAVTDPEANTDWLADKSITHIPEIAYLEEMIRNLIRFPLVPFVLLGVVALFWSGGKHRWSILGCFLLMLGVLTYVARLGTWYIIPALPALCVAAAIGLGGLRSCWFRALAATGTAAAAIWLRWSMAYAPGAAMKAAIAKFPTATWLVWAQMALGPQTVISGDDLHGRITVKEGAAAHAIGEVAREMQSQIHPSVGVVRVIVLSATQQREFSTCWVVNLEAPRATCLSGVSGWYANVPTTLWNPLRYDLVAWVDENGLRELNLAPTASLPAALRTALDRINPAEQAGPRALLEHLHDLPWTTVTTPVGPVYRRVRVPK